MTSEQKVTTKVRVAGAIHQSSIQFTGNEKHLISLDEACQLIRNYQESVPSGSILGGSFSKEIFDKLLIQQSCVGIRIYFAAEDDGTPSFVLTGVASPNRDLFQGILATYPLMNTLPFDPLPGIPGQSTASQESEHYQNHLTTLAEASRLTRNFRKSAQGTLYKGAYLGKNIFQTILRQPDCVGINIWYARHNDGEPTFVLGGVDRMGHQFKGWLYGQEVYWCPPWCAPFNSLNH